VLDAHNFFDAPGSPKPPLRRNTFGGVISGPVWIPKIYDGHNKSFFTFNGELYRERRSTQGFGIYPTDRMKRGDLTEAFFRRADGSFIPSWTSKRKALSRESTGQYRPLPKTVPVLPAPNLGATESSGVNNSGVSRNADNDDQYFVRGDHNFNERTACSTLRHPDRQPADLPHQPESFCQPPSAAAAERNHELHAGTDADLAYVQGLL
jgi:hypothetical protein